MKKHGNVFKNWLCPNFLLLPKKSELPKIWGGGATAPPGPYAYDSRFPPNSVPGFFWGEDGAFTQAKKKGLQQTKRYRLKSIKDFELKPLSSWSRKFNQKKVQT